MGINQGSGVDDRAGVLQFARKKHPYSCLHHRQKGLVSVHDDGIKAIPLHLLTKLAQGTNISNLHELPNSLH